MKWQENLPFFLSGKFFLHNPIRALDSMMNHPLIIEQLLLCQLIQPLRGVRNRVPSAQSSRYEFTRRCFHSVSAGLRTPRPPLFNTCV